MVFNQSVVVDVLQMINYQTMKHLELSIYRILVGKADLILNGTKVKVTPELNSKIPVTFSYTFQMEIVEERQQKYLF